MGNELCTRTDIRVAVFTSIEENNLYTLFVQPFFYLFFSNLILFVILSLVRATSYPQSVLCCKELVHVLDTFRNPRCSGPFKDPHVVFEHKKLTVSESTGFTESIHLEVLLK